MSESEGVPDAVLADFLSALDCSNGAGCPPAVRIAVAQHSLEILTCLFAGANIPEMRPVLEAAARAHGTVAVPTTAVHSEPSLAAGAIAALSHAAELDPIHTGTIVCPAAVSIPTALALANVVPLSGTRYIAAVCAGYETAIRLGRALNGAALLAMGWWPTAVCGSIAAAATAGICLGLKGIHLQDALGLAAVQSGGLALGGSGSPVARNLLCANTVRMGVDAALAASCGVTGPREIFSGSRNLITAFGAKGDPASLLADRSQRWAILETTLKPWPCAMQAQSSLDALSGLMNNRIFSGSPRFVDIQLPAAMQRIVDRPGEPGSRWAASASLQFLAAAMLVDGNILDSRMDCGRSDARVLEQMSRVRVSADTSLDHRYPREWPARVTLRDSSGVASAESALPLGHPDRPLPFAASEARFRDRAAQHLPSGKIEGAIAFLRTLEQQEDVSPLMTLLSAA